MRNIISILLVLFTGLCFAQEKLVHNETISEYTGYSYKVMGSLSIKVLPGNEFRVSAATDGTFRAYAYNRKQNINGSQNQNYIRTEVARVAGLQDEYEFARAPVEDKSIEFEYFDNLGRSLQSINVQNSPNNKDVIVPVVYDDFGRQHLQYLPYEAGATNGKYRLAAESEDISFYEDIKGDSRPFTEVLFEDSPLNRPIGQYDPGEVWKSNGKKKERIVLINGSNEIRKWTIENDEPISFKYYPQGALIGTKTIDEDGREVVEYNDFRGLKVVSRKLGDAGQWHDTYYIHDAFGQVRYVLSPEALNDSPDAVSGEVEFVGGSKNFTNANFEGKNIVYGSNATVKLRPDFNFTATATNKFSITSGAPPVGAIDGFAYAYIYDAKRRLIKKKLPGKDWEYFVYDRWDRLVLSQDGELRKNNRWIFVKYDELNREVMKGYWTQVGTQEDLAIEVEAETVHHEIENTSAEGYTRHRTFPKTPPSDDLFQINYYDDYSFKNNAGWDAEGHGFNYVNEPEMSSVKTTHGLKGQVTGGKIRVGESGMWLNTVHYYDDKYQNIQTKTENHLGGMDRISNEYDFTGLVTKTKHYQEGSGMDSFTVLETFEYDHAGRLLKTYHSIGGASPVLIAENNYNEVGELIERNHYSPAGEKLQSVDFNYNIRGWLTGINNTDLDEGENDLFGMDLYYHNAPAVNGSTPIARYNGNIAAMSWNTNNQEETPQPKIYGYGYDMLERLKSATYATKSGATWDANQNHFDVSITDYDKNGNILGLERWTKNGGGKTKIDELTYTYSGNQLLNVKDYTGNDFGFKDLIGSPTELTEYAYDANGNMLYDMNKGIEELDYNHLNLPTAVRLVGNRTIYYEYDAAGSKLYSRAVDGGTEINRTDYVNGAHYKNGALDFVSMSYGRVVKRNGNWEYEYFLNDHWGNTRVTYGYTSETNDYLATMETEKSTEEDAEFTRLSPKSTMFNHTKGQMDLQTPDEALFLRAVSGNMNNAMGAGKYLEVKSGDKITTEVFAHYEVSSGDPSQIFPGIVTAVASSFGTALGGVEGSSAQSALNSDLPGIVNGMNPGSAPKAYLIYMLFNEGYSNLEQHGFKPISMSAASGWEKLEFEGQTVTMGSDGHLFIYVANESAIDVFFDDLKIVHEKQNNELQVTQSQDYYPFGLTYNAHQKEVASVNQYKFQGQEHQADFDLGWSQFKWRNSDPAIGRFFNIDPIAEDYYYNSTYAFSENKVIAHVELEGLESHYAADGNVVANGPLRQKAIIEAQISYANKKNSGFPFKNAMGHLRNVSVWVSQRVMNRPAVACWRTTNIIMQYANIDGGYRGTNNSNVIQTALEVNGNLEITSQAQTGVDYIDSQISDGALVTVGVNHTIGKSLNQGTTDHFVVIDGKGYDTEIGQVFYTFNEVNSKNENDGKSDKNRFYLNDDGSLSGTNYKGTYYTVSQVRMNKGKIRDDPQ